MKNREPIRTKTIYTPQSEVLNPLKMIREMFADAYRAKELAVALFKRDIKAQFRQSILGYAWLFFPPVATTFIWFFLNSSGVVTVAETGIPYPAFVMIGTLLWQAFLDSLTKPIQALNRSRSMLIKLNFPREAPILAAIAETTLTSLVRLLLLIPIFIFVNLELVWTACLFPLGYFAMVLSGTAIGLLFTPLGLLYTDVSRALQLIGQFAMYATPIVYPIATSGILSKINALNPLTYLIETSRNTLNGGPFDLLPQALLVTGMTCIIFFLAWCIFRVTIPRVIERMGM